jgi:dimethyl-sulfide monooxygenase
MFILTTGPDHARTVTEDIRNIVEQAGRPRDAIKIFTLLTVVTGSTDAQAQQKYEDYLQYASPEGMLALYGGWTGIDFSKLDPDEPLQAMDNDSLRTTLESLTEDGGKNVSVRDVIKERCIGGLGPVLVGGPEKVADELERWVDYGGVDGFNLAYAITPGSVTDFIDYVRPELVKRGRAQTSYAPGTLREKLVPRANGSYTADDHPATKYRGSLVGKESVDDKTTDSPWAETETPFHAH